MIYTNAEIAAMLQVAQDARERYHARWNYAQNSFAISEATRIYDGALAPLEDAALIYFGAAWGYDSHAMRSAANGTAGTHSWALRFAWQAAWRDLRAPSEDDGDAKWMRIAKACQPA